MSLIFDCPHCGFRTELSEGTKTHEQPCSRCGRRFDEPLAALTAPVQYVLPKQPIKGHWLRILAWVYRLAAIGMAALGLFVLANAMYQWATVSRPDIYTRYIADLVVSGASCLLGGLLLLPVAEGIMLFLQLVDDVRALRRHHEQPAQSGVKHD